MKGTNCVVRCFVHISLELPETQKMSGNENNFLKRNFHFLEHYKYRIYPRISREILEKVLQIFFQFDLYAGNEI